MIYKQFEEKWESVKERLGTMTGKNNNIDGENLQIAWMRMMKRKEKRKVIISICDGDPCAGQSNDHVMAKNIINVCKSLRRKKCEVYAFGIGTNSPSIYYGNDWFVRLDPPMDQKFFKQIVKIMSGDVSDMKLRKAC